ncbi:Meiosis Expressed 1 Protein-like [Manis pentadactyla]|nr:Meiosis Expressed 1 Protein-like [Manis pentadactyla]
MKESSILQGERCHQKNLAKKVNLSSATRPKNSFTLHECKLAQLDHGLQEEIIGNKTAVAMASSDVKPKSVSRAKKWSEEIENLYRFQQAGYRDEIEYKQVKQVSMVDRWPETGYVKKLQRRNNTFYYYNRQRECDDKEVHKVKIYAY